nr:PREDICTED: complement decay-accelerating factor, GPI-anchored-like [Anolis carolinensis]|eukprot:XP_016850976.1 PREDICTED: complement decay-accelerating factor, GPI-anchored-like [Anolis carolinensis]
MESVTYKCLDGFYNIYGKLDVVTCLSDSTWSDIEEFCQRSCYSPSRYRFARPRLEDIKTYYPANTRVTYICRPGYDTIPGISSVVTCLENNYTWTNLPVFCEGKSCGDPGKPENGEVVILTNLLFSAKVNFICAEGYILVGVSSAQCVLKGDGVEWKPEPPKCQRQTSPTKSPTSENKPFGKETTNRGTGKQLQLTGARLQHPVPTSLPLPTLLNFSFIFQHVVLT